MKKTHVFLGLAFCMLAPLLAPGQKKENQSKYVKGEVIVHFQDGVLDHARFPVTAVSPPKLGIKQTLKNQGLVNKLEAEGITQIRKLFRKASPQKKVSISRTGEEVSVPDFYNVMHLYVQDDIDILALCGKLSKIPGVRYAEPNYIMRVHDFTPNDLFINQQEYLFQPLNSAHINARRAWDFSTGSSAVKVAVIDSGIDYDHPDLGGSFGPSAPKVKGGYDYENQDSNPDDDHENSHGTSVAGIIGALSNNNQGIAGIAGGNAAQGNPGVELYALKVVDANGTVDFSDAAEAIYDASTSVGTGGYGCHILNISAGYLLGQEPDWKTTLLRKAVSYAALNGSVFVASKGNGGDNAFNFPSDFSDNLVLSVGASDNADTRAQNSGYGNKMDFVAPGTSDMIYTTAIGGGYHSFDLTSASTPIVAGIASLLKSVNPNLHRDDVEKIMEISADKVNPLIYDYIDGYNEEMGHGRVNAGKALELLNAPWVLQHYTATGGTSQKLSPGNGEGLTFWNDANTSLAEGWYFGEMHQVTQTVNLPVSACGQQFVWSRTVNATTGWSAANPNNNLGFNFVVSQTATTATLRTFVYFIRYNALGQTINAWYPTSPEGVVFAYTTLTDTPLSNSISGSSLVCSGATYLYPNQPAGTTVSWSSNNPGLSINSGGAATRINNYNGSAIVTATLNTSCGSFPVSKNVFVGPPFAAISLNGTSMHPDYWRYVEPGVHTLSVLRYGLDESGQNTNVNFKRTKNPGGTITYYNSTASPADYTWGIIHYGETYIFELTTSNTCGSWSGYAIVTTNGEIEPEFATYPNPSDKEVTVIMPEETKEGESYQIVLHDRNLNKVHESVHQGRETKFSVQNLDEGIYHLTIIVGDQQLTRHLAVKRR